MKATCKPAVSFRGENSLTPHRAFHRFPHKNRICSHISICTSSFREKGYRSNTSGRFKAYSSARLNGHTPRKLPARRRQSLASSHIRLVYYNIFCNGLQYLFLVRFVEFSFYFCHLKDILHKTRAF